MEFTERLKQYRKSAHLTQQQVAKQLGISQQAYGDWERGVKMPTHENSKKLARLLYEEAEKRGLKGNRSVPTEKYWVQSLAMCRDTKCPAVLTENMFMDNKQDKEFLLSKEGREKIIDLHVQGIIKYING